MLLRTTKYYSSTTPYYKALLERRQNDVLPVLLQDYKVLLQYYKVLLRTTKYYSSTTPYYKDHSSTTPYYKVLLQYYKVLLRTTKYYKVLLRTTKYYSSTTPYYKVLLRTTSVTKYYSALQSTTKYYSTVLVQYYKVLLRTTKYYSVLQSTTPVLLRTTKYYSSTTRYYKVLLQYYSVLQSTSPYYKVLQGTTPVLLRTTKYYSSTTPYYKVLLRTTKYYKVLLQHKALLQPLERRQNDILPVLLHTTPVLQKLPKRAFRARLPQLFKQQASKTSISCEASATFRATSFQNEHFVRGFRNFSSTKLPKRAFRARLPQLFKQQASKTSVSCEASASFQATSFQNEHFVRGFRNFSKKKLPKSCACHAKRENDLSP